MVTIQRRSLTLHIGPIVVGAIAGVVLLNLVILFYCLARRRRRMRERMAAAEEAKQFDADKSFAALGPSRRSFTSAPPVPPMPPMPNQPLRSKHSAPQLGPLSPVSPFQSANASQMQSFGMQSFGSTKSKSGEGAQMQSFGSLSGSSGEGGYNRPEPGSNFFVRQPEPAAMQQQGGRMRSPPPADMYRPQTAPEGSQRMRQPLEGAAQLRSPPPGLSPRIPMGTAARLRTPPQGSAPQWPEPSGLTSPVMGTAARLRTPPQGSAPQWPEPSGLTSPVMGTAARLRSPQTGVAPPFNDATNRSAPPPSFQPPQTSNRRGPSVDSHILPPSEYAATEYSPTHSREPSMGPGVTQGSSLAVRRNPSKATSRAHSRKHNSMDTESIYSEATGAWGAGEFADSPKSAPPSEGPAFVWPLRTNGDKPIEGPWAKIRPNNQQPNNPLGPETWSRIQWKVDSPPDGSGKPTHTPNKSSDASSRRHYRTTSQALAEQQAEIPPLPQSVKVTPPTGTYAQRKPQAKMSESMPVTASMTPDQVAVAALLRKRAQAAQDGRQQDSRI